MEILTRTFTVDREAYLRAVWFRTFPYDVRRLLPSVVLSIVAVAFVSGWASIFLGLIEILSIAAVKFAQDRRVLYDPAYEVPVFAPRSMEITDLKVRTHAANGITSALHWSELSPAERRGRFTLLCKGGTPTLTVPDAAFESPHDLAAFLDLVGRACEWKRPRDYAREWIGLK